MCQFVSWRGGCLLQWFGVSVLAVLAVSAMVFLQLKYEVFGPIDYTSIFDYMLVVGNTLATITLVVSSWHIIQHMRHFTQPALQKPIISILCMVPIYAIDAWFGLRVYKDSILYQDALFFDLIREVYQAYVIYTFMALLLNYMEVQTDENGSREYEPFVPIHIPFPFCCLPTIVVNRQFIAGLKYGILQYVVVRPITAIISVICKNHRIDSADPYILVVNLLSLYAARYGIEIFLQVHKNELQPLNPAPKYMCVRAVIFLTFIQHLLITFFVNYGVHPWFFPKWPPEEMDKFLNNFVVRFEMFVAAIAHWHYFSYKPFVQNTAETDPLITRDRQSDRESNA